MLALPQGFRDLLPHEAEVFYFVKERLVSLFFEWGYLPIVPSTIEHLTTFSLSGEKEEEMFTFIDQREGKGACFRYDFTPQIARILATHSFDLPVKFFYDGVVLRNTKNLSGEGREIYQAGVEIVGEDSLHSDLELILLAHNIAKVLNIKDFKIFLSDVGILKALFRDEKRPDYFPQQLKEAFIEKNISSIEKIVSQLSMAKEKKDLLIELPLLCGEISMLYELERRYPLKEMGISIESLKRLGEEAKTLQIDVFFDLGEVRGFEYHTGILIDCYGADGVGNFKEVIVGGRYDSLLTAYLGRSVPATGFAVDVKKLCSLVGVGQKPFVALIEDGGSYKRLYSIANLLREEGFRVDVTKAKKGSIDEMVGKKRYDYVLLVGRRSLKGLSLKEKKEWVIEDLRSDFINVLQKDMVK